MTRLKQALDARGITVRSCADLLNISESSLRNKISGTTEFTYGEVLTLRRFLPEYNMDYLLSDLPEEEDAEIR